MRQIRLLFLGLLFAAMGAAGHSCGETWSTIAVSGNTVNVSYFIQTSDLAQHLPDLAYSPELPALLTEAITGHFLVFAEGVQCPVEGVDFRHTINRIEVSFGARCVSGKDLTIRNEALFDRLPNHLHISQASINAQAFKERLFIQSDPVWVLTSDTGLVGTLKRYLGLGVEHILSGYDHLAFLFAVMLLAPRAMTLVLMITGFTIGHSITLALAVLGHIKVNAGAVEALIGFTIALVAAEVVARRHRLDQPLVAVTAALLLLMAFLGSTTSLVSSGPGPATLIGLAIFSVCYLLLSRAEDVAGLVNPALTVLFGMIHGFGFASLLLEIGLPTLQLLPALVGFNLGVEVGQLIVIGLVLAGALLLRRLMRLPWYTPDAVASALCGLGLFLFVSRSF